MINLPTEKRKVNGQIEPRKMMIFSQPKTGKSSNLGKLPKSLIVDYESGANYYECMSIDVKAEAAKLNVGPITFHNQLAAEIKKANLENGSPVYDFIILDTMTELENLATNLATHLYKSTTIGKNFTGTNCVVELPNGQGYNYLRLAFEQLLQPFDNLAGKCLIYSGHAKSASITKKGETLTAKDINLTGKLKMIIAADMDCTGFLYRKKGGKENILSFYSEEQDLVTGSRIPELSGKELVISTMNDKNELTTHWHLIFPSLKEQK